MRVLICFSSLLLPQNHIDAGHPVIFGVYQTKLDGDDEYDHIVIATGYETSVRTGAVVGLRYNDLFLPEHLRLTAVCTRAQCARRAAPSPKGEFAFQYSLPRQFVSAMAVVGTRTADAANAWPRVQLHVSQWDEPDWGAEDAVCIIGWLFGVSVMVLTQDTHVIFYSFVSYGRAAEK